MSKQIGGLGRGLDALLGGAPDEIENPLMTDRSSEGDIDRVMNIRISDIDPNPDQPRKRFDETALTELAASIQTLGVLQPIIVRKTGSRYTIISGERRWRASRMAQLTEIPAIVRDWDQVKRLEAALVENLQRDDLNPVEEAMGLNRLMEQCGLTQEETAQRVSKSRSAVANSLRLLNLPEEILNMLKDGRLSAGHARALVSVSPDRQLKLAQQAVEQGWSVRQMEKAAAEPTAPARSSPTPKAAPDPQMKQLERMARDVFGAKAELNGDERHGKLILHYATADDLQRIWDLLEFLQQSEA